MTLALPEWAERISTADAVELACKADVGVWAERKRGFENSVLHWEWADLIKRETRLAVVAPREHAKSESFTINQIAWRCTYEPGIWCYIFAQTGDQAKALKSRIDSAILETAPWLAKGAQMNSTSSVYANFSRVDCAGSGKGVRGVHPDLVVGDDVLEEHNCLTAYQRQAVARWWFGTVGGMAHPGTTRVLGDTGVRVRMPPTRVHLIGTPFHREDLLMGMRLNPMYRFYRYSAEYDPKKLPNPDSLAVEIA